MSRAILVLGESGTGKTRALRTLEPKETALINIVGKDVPFPGSAKYYRGEFKDGGNLFIPDFSTVFVAREAASKIITSLRYLSHKREDIKNVVVDDFQYLMALEFFRETGAGNKDWARFENVGLHAIEVFEQCRSMRDDMTVFITAHTEEAGKGDKEKTVMKTQGQMVRKQFTPEGLFTVVLMTDPLKDLERDRILEYRFRTQNSGSDVTKSPEDMFPLYIPNDYRLVRDRIEEYYNEGTTVEESVVLKPVLEAQAKKTEVL